MSETVATSERRTKAAPVRSAGPSLALYHFEGCPHCTKVRRAAARLGIPLELHDVRQEPARRAELLKARGRPTVPVLRIEGPEGVRWLPESDEIVAWLHARAGVEPPPGPGVAERLLGMAPWFFLAMALFVEGPTRVVLLLGAALLIGLQVMGSRSTA